MLKDDRNRAQWERKDKSKIGKAENGRHLAKDIRSNRKFFYVYVIGKRNKNEVGFFLSCAVKVPQEEGEKA